MAKENTQKKSNGSALDFEAQLWAAAEQAVPAPDCKKTEYNGARPEGLCLGLIFLKYISDAFEEKREQLLFGFSDPMSEWFIKDEPGRAEAAENRDEYLAANVFWLPPEARWHTIKAKAKSPEIGKVIDDAMGAIERENPTLKGVLPRDYARPSLDTATRASANRICESHRQDFCGAKDHVRLGGLVDIISNIGFNESAAKSKDVLGRVYEYSLGKFASAFDYICGEPSEASSTTGTVARRASASDSASQFYTPQCVVQVLVAMLEPYKGRVFYPSCGSGGIYRLEQQPHRARLPDVCKCTQQSSTRWCARPAAGLLLLRKSRTRTLIRHF
jgi:type I restriction enzyme M protein